MCSLGIQRWITILSDRADRGDVKAERALAKLRDAFEEAAPLCGEQAPLNEGEFYPVYDALLVLEQAIQGRAEYPPDLLRSIALNTVEDCRALGLDPPDISFFLKQKG